MPKYTAKEIKPGMRFVVVSHDPAIEIGGVKAMGKGYNPPIGDILEVRKAVFKNPGQQITWREVSGGDQTEWTSFWSVFKKNTEPIH